jgi:hypothetical protein
VQVCWGTWHWTSHDAAEPVCRVKHDSVSAAQVGQSPSQVSPISTTVLPHIGVQSVSLVALHVAGQQSSPLVHAV